MKKILIVDASDYQNELCTIYREYNYEVECCETAFDAIAKLNASRFDLIVSQVQLPGDNAFELYYYITKNFPYLPIIMVTHKNIDEFFDEIIEEGIGNVLHKPVQKDELINLSEKLVNRTNIFGLENYIPFLKIHKKLRINASAQIREAITIMLKYIHEWEFIIDNKIMFNLLLNEILINAVYHAHGLTKEKIARRPVVLQPGQFVDIHFGCSDDLLGVSIVDYNGTLSKKIVLQSMYNVITEKKLIEEAAESGADISNLISETGRGIELVRQLASEYYFILHKNHQTEIILLFQKKLKFKKSNHSSLKIIELGDS